MSIKIITLTMLLPMLECGTYCDSIINVCFFTNDGFSKNLIDAQDICPGNQGILLEIYNQDYQNAVVNAFKKLGLGDEFCWLNLKYANGVYKWHTNGTVATYTKWNTNEPAYSETTFLISTVYPYNWFFDRDVSDMFHPVMCIKEEQQTTTNLTTTPSTTTTSTSTRSTMPTSVSTSTLPTSVATSTKSTLPTSVKTSIKSTLPIPVLPFPITSTSTTNTTTISTHTITITSDLIPTDPASSTITTPTTTTSSNVIPTSLNSLTSITAAATTSTDGVTIETTNISINLPTTALILTFNTFLSYSETRVNNMAVPLDKLTPSAIGAIAGIASVLMIIAVSSLVYLFLIRHRRIKPKNPEQKLQRTLEPMPIYSEISIYGNDVASDTISTTYDQLRPMSDCVYDEMSSELESSFQQKPENEQILNQELWPEMYANAQNIAITDRSKSNNFNQAENLLINSGNIKSQAFGLNTSDNKVSISSNNNQNRATSIAISTAYSELNLRYFPERIYAGMKRVYENNVEEEPENRQIVNQEITSQLCDNVQNVEITGHGEKDVFPHDYTELLNEQETDATIETNIPRENHHDENVSSVIFNTPLGPRLSEGSYVGCILGEIDQPQNSSQTDYTSLENRRPTIFPRYTRNLYTNLIFNDYSVI